MLFLRTDGDPSSLYLYNYLVQDRTVVQSAWNKWRLPVQSIVWASVFRQDLLVLAQLPGGAALLKFPLRSSAVDHPGADYRTRLDLRVDEGVCTVAYDLASDTTLIQPPYGVPPGDVAQYRVVSRISGVFVRGRGAATVQAEGGGLRVRGDWTAQPFYLGRLIDSRRVESTFYLRTEEGVVPTDSITLREYRLRYASTGYTRLEADLGAGRVKTDETRHIPIGFDPAIGQPPIIRAGSLPIVIDNDPENSSVTLINDTWLPSRWQTADWRYEAVLRARVGSAGSTR